MIDKNADTLTNIERIAFVLWIVLTALSIAWRDARVLAGVAAGGAFALGNFRILKGVVGRVFRDPENLKPAYFAILVPKFVILAGLLWVIVTSGWFNLAAFAVGTLSLLISVVAVPFLTGGDAVADSAKDADGSNGSGLGS
ncbi:MAG: hypothetical protein IT350_01635 [Deltaproteobacteria bacterium]|nr:hypothetical protein [Deltaproteobacteria bacterium]